MPAIEPLAGPLMTGERPSHHRSGCQPYTSPESGPSYMPSEAERLCSGNRPGRVLAWGNQFPLPSDDSLVGGIPPCRCAANHWVRRDSELGKVIRNLIVKFLDFVQLGGSVRCPPE